MWQFLLAAAAAAGSGVIAKKLINPLETEKPSDFTQNSLVSDENKHLKPGDSIFSPDDAFRENSSISEEKRESTGDYEDIFRFSSLQEGSKELKKKERNGCRKNGGAKRGEKSESEREDGEKELIMDKRRNRSGRRVAVCVKKRRTNKHVAGKCESCTSKKDNSFGWGVGIGIMYMMSAGKAEISRLNSAVDETGKIVQEIKAEISRRKSSSNVPACVSENDSNSIKKDTEGSLNNQLLTKPHNKNKNNTATLGTHLIDDSECGSSGLIENQQPEEMEQLEAELEFELQKLPWCATESSGSEERPHILEAEVSESERQPDGCWNPNTHQHNGVIPAELDNKLCHVLIEQQGSQITELEAELHQAQSKLQEKDAELRALKNCVKRLGEFSLASASDEETENREDKKTRDEMEELHFGPPKSGAGTKRAMDCDSTLCSFE